MPYPISHKPCKTFCIEYEARLAEEAVLRAVETRAVHGFRAERNRLYEIREPEERDATFRHFHAAWFERLNLGIVIWQALQEQPIIAATSCACIVAYACSTRDEGAELFVSAGREGTGEAKRRSVGIRLGPQRLLDDESLLTFLRHELFHIADMLDPGFAYEPRLPVAELGPANERLLQDRYRVLWDTYIDGRLMRRNWAPASVRELRLQEFAKAFPMLGGRVGEAFVHVFNGTALKHPGLVAFAVSPVAFFASSLVPPVSPSKCVVRDSKLPADSGPHAGQRCPLCGFPTYAFVGKPDQLPRDLQNVIRTDFPEWESSRGLCQQCADLYYSRS